MSDSTTYDFSSPLQDPGETKSTLTVLDRLRGVVEKKVARDLIFITVPEREGVLIRISPNITQEQIKKWRKNAGEGTKDGFSATRFACAVVAGTCQGILLDGEEVFGKNGAKVSFASQEILDMTDTHHPLDAAQKLFGLDPHVEAAALAVMEAAGYSDSVEVAEDPTKKS